MPTPSSNPPPDPHSPRSHGFSSCPDDANVRTAPRSWQPPTDATESSSAMDIQPSRLEMDGVSPAAVSATTPDTVAETEGTETVIDEEATSRSTTQSPGPQSIAPLQSPLEALDLEAEPFKRPVAGGDSQPVIAGASLTNTRTTLGVRPHAGYDPTTPAPGDWDSDLRSTWQGALPAPSMSSPYSSMRVIATSPSSYLRPGSRFHGTQQSEKQVYDVQVEIKHVDLRESFLCGYLRIQGLTEDHPTLTTYFEGEIIGTKYSFITKHESWGATDKIDLNHWAKFSAFRPFQKQARKGPVVIRDVAQRENIFMRWKEHFLVPDHRVRTITGASFEGFYYICFNQIKGEVSGIYFHSKSEKFQQLELKHVEDRGCFSAMEFR